MKVCRGLSPIHKSALPRIKTIGFSERGIPLRVERAGRETSPMKVFVMAGQHGDESGAREALARLMSAYEVYGGRALPPVQVAALVNANPDGSSERRRVNDKGVDLNRDHLMLESKEARAVHSFVAGLRPQVIVDAHNYPPRRRKLLAQGKVIDTDVFLDTPTLPRLPVDGPSPGLGRALVGAVKSDLNRLGYSCERYLLFKPSGKVRTSSLGLLDARNSLALRHDALAVLVEGRAPTKRESEDDRERLVDAQYHALLSILRWAWRNRDAFAGEARSVPPSTVPIRWRYTQSQEPFQAIFRSIRTGKKETVVFNRCYAQVRATRFVSLPFAYAVPLGSTRVREVLSRHGFAEVSDFWLPPSATLVDLSGRTPPQTGAGHFVGGKEGTQHRLGGYVLYPTGRDGGAFLAVLLEPDSKYGLGRHGLMGPEREASDSLPILRVERGRRPPGP